ncbi:glyoxylate reductase [Sporothrix brasiliensis 5110]|uniref:Glyoxylate reductase n=1 Tax=Sporothrix brasiliensis 5110 TaxID=1398154 RepID=A0A0C2EMW3_9PEZI|nr:glyoxylate reductase [Sporothrix brasiliensis 5110]KIH87464.1 glyoxylate reductase [Sporothrix brasiliensis 5110]
MKPKALLLGRIDHATASWQALADLADPVDLVTTAATSRAELLAECRSGALDGVVAIFDRAPHSTSTTGPFDEELIGALPASVRFLAHNGAGYDNIDVAACTRRRIRVSHCPRVVDEATADTAVFLILAALREFNNGIMAIRQGTWTGLLPPEPLGRDPRGKVLGILGLGGIGRCLQRKMAAFGMTEVVYHNRTRLRPDDAGGAEYVSFGELLARSDVLSLNLPLNAGTRNIVSTAAFAQMKRGIVIVNTARGGVLDEAALVDALAKGIVSSVGLDVYQSEPNIHPALVANPRVCLLPHMGTSTVETKTQMEELAISNVRSALTTGKLVTPVPEQRHLDAQET